MVDLTLAGGQYKPIGAQPIRNFMKPVNMSPDLSLAGTNFQTGSNDPLNLDFSNQGSPGFDFSNAMNNFSMGAQGITGLANAYNAYKQMGLMEDQLGLQKGLANRNIANSAATTNRLLDDKATVAAQMFNNEYGTPEYLAAKEKLKTTVDGSPVA